MSALQTNVCCMNTHHYMGKQSAALCIGLCFPHNTLQDLFLERRRTIKQKLSGAREYVFGVIFAATHLFHQESLATQYGNSPERKKFINRRFIR